MCFWEGKGWRRLGGRQDMQKLWLVAALPCPTPEKAMGLHSADGWEILPCWSHPDTLRSPMVFAGHRVHGSPMLTCAMDNGGAIPHPRRIFCPFVAPSVSIHQRLSQSQSNAPYLNKDQALSFILNTAVQRRQKTEQTNSNSCKALSTPGTDWEIICCGDRFSSLRQPAMTPPSSYSLLDTQFATSKACEKPPEMALSCHWAALMGGKASLGWKGAEGKYEDRMRRVSPKGSIPNS